jgi:hypothetical protein
MIKNGNKAGLDEYTKIRCTVYISFTMPLPTKVSMNMNIISNPNLPVIQRFTHYIYLHNNNTKTIVGNISY